MNQWWRDLCFLHWRVDPGTVAPHLPRGVRPDTDADGAAWVGLIPFRMVEAGLGATRPVPWSGTFLELNVRTYGVDAAGRRGVVFRSLEAERAAVVVEVGERLAAPTSTEHFLTARFGLHTSVLGRTVWVPNTHEPWPLHAARVLHLEDGLLEAAGLPGLATRPPDSVLWSPGVRTRFGVPQRVRPARGRDGRATGRGSGLPSVA